MISFPRNYCMYPIVGGVLGSIGYMKILSNFRKGISTNDNNIITRQSYINTGMYFGIIMGMFSSVSEVLRDHELFVFECLKYHFLAR